MWDAIASAGGAILGSVANAAGQLFVNKKNERFTRHMAGTQYQRSVDDMRRAGLNPMYMFGAGGGSQAAAPSGQMQNPLDFASTAKTAQDIYGARLANRMARERLDNDLELGRQQIALANAQARSAIASAEVNEKEMGVVSQALEGPAAQSAVLASRYAGSWPANVAATAAAGIAAAKGIHKVWGGQATARQAVQMSQDAEQAAYMIRHHGGTDKDVPDPYFNRDDSWWKQWGYELGEQKTFQEELRDHMSKAELRYMAERLDERIRQRDRRDITDDGSSAKQRREQERVKRHRFYD